MEQDKSKNVKVLWNILNQRLWASKWEMPWKWSMYLCLYQDQRAGRCSLIQMNPAYVIPAYSTHSPFLSLPDEIHTHILRKMAAFSLQLAGGSFWHEWIYTTHSKKVKAFFLFTQVKKQKTGLKYIRVQFHENRDFCFVPVVFLAPRTGP